jgi:diguanylate cyclase (GGDEF)-like protein
MRLDGDKFAVILRNSETAASIDLPIDLIITALRTPVDIEDNSIQIGASVGVIFYPKDGEEGEGLIKIADQALYEAKKSRRNCYRIFDYNISRAIQ